MKEYTKDEFINDSTDPESIYAVRSVNGKLQLLYDMEYWEEPKDLNGNPKDYGDDNYRIEEFGELFVTNDWVLNGGILDCEPFASAVDDVRGRMCGGIYFYHEGERESGINVKEDFYGMVKCYAETATDNVLPLSIIGLYDEEMEYRHSSLQDGVYILLCLGTLSKQTPKSVNTVSG